MHWFSSDVRIMAVVIVSLLLLKFVLNLARFVRMKRYLEKYKKWHSTRDEKFLESKSQVVRLVRDAGVSDQRISVSEHVGYGNLRVTEASVMDNFPHLSQDMSSAAQRLMREAIGTYRARMRETFNPLYWIEYLVYLPREVLDYLGVPAESIFVKVLQIVWWAIGTILSLLYVVYRPEIRVLIERWITSG